jgi:hypothetical protein
MPVLAPGRSTAARPEPRQRVANQGLRFDEVPPRARDQSCRSPHCSYNGRSGRILTKKIAYSGTSSTLFSVILMRLWRKFAKDGEGLYFGFEPRNHKGLRVAESQHVYDGDLREAAMVGTCENSPASARRTKSLAALLVTYGRPQILIVCSHPFFRNRQAVTGETPVDRHQRLSVISAVCESINGGCELAPGLRGTSSFSRIGPGCRSMHCSGRASLVDIAPRLCALGTLVVRNAHNRRTPRGG